MGHVLLVKDQGHKENERLIKFVKLYKPWFDESKIQKHLEVFDLMEKFVEHPTSA